MKKSLLLSLFVFTVLNAQNLAVVEDGDDYKYVTISKNDTSRILCQSGDIGSIVYSKDKEFAVKKDGKNAYIKLSSVITKSDNTIVDKQTNDFKRELYLTCDGKTYSLILEPKDMPAQTIILKDRKSELTQGKKNIAEKFEKSRDYETTLLELIKNAYKEVTPDGYGIEPVDQIIADFKELTLILNKKYGGDEFEVREYLIKAKTPLLNMEEKLFIDFLPHPLAIALENLNVEVNQISRMFVVLNKKPERFTYEEKVKNFSESLSKHEEKKQKYFDENKVHKSEEKMKTEVDQKILDFIENDKKNGSLQ